MSNSILTGLGPFHKRTASFSSQQDQSQSDVPTSPSNSVLPLYGGSQLSSSVQSTHGFREPIRSFIQGTVRDVAPIDSLQNARSVREDTAELADYLLSNGSSQRRQALLQRSRASIHDVFNADSDVASTDDNIVTAETIPEVPEPESPPENANEPLPEDGPSVLANMLRRSPPQSGVITTDGAPSRHVTIAKADRPSPSQPDVVEEEGHIDIFPNERTSLLHGSSYDRRAHDLEGQKKPRKTFFRRVADNGKRIESHVSYAAAVAFNPRRWDGRIIWQSAVVDPVSCLPAVAVGLLLNILDALSYGMILFPLGNPIFANLGSAGISIYYVSTIVAQVIFSTGSIFKGAVGSELIEVVPFFHNMAGKIVDIVGQDKPDEVIATTIVAYACSSMMTGMVFYLMGKFKFGYMVGFIPRHILIGCIGGVGWFLVATGFEVSARLDGNLEYNFDTWNQLTSPDKLLLWIFPFVLSIVLFYGQAKVASKYFLPLFILAIPLVFYILVFSVDALDTDHLRSDGWIFEGPPPGEPWWFFYTLYQFQLVHWDAIIEVIPAMMALTFFGILHVPINVPALALQTGEDNANLDKELKLHGYSNFFSGCIGSIQNYLVYANTVFVIRSGGNRRLAGYMLAAATFVVMMIGPSIIGFIPIMMVGTLIFDLGWELLMEAIWLPRKKLKTVEYLTVIIIVLVMGMYDFVVGIGVGILLAFITLVVQTSRVSAIRGCFDGDIVSSTVRRNPSQHTYLHQVGQQIYIMKLTGYLFFGTIVSVEEKIRGLLEDECFAEKPIKFLILDLWHVSDLDYSAGEAFNTISRILDKKGVVLVLSGVDPDGQLGRNLRAVGIGGGGIEVIMLPNLNSALESCENELLKTLYLRQEEINENRRLSTANLDVPSSSSAKFSSFDAPFNSPRQSHLVEAAHHALNSAEVQRPLKWQSFSEPLRLMLQIFQGLSDKNEDFWFEAIPYFARKEFVAGTTLFRRGEVASGFYLLERGILRAEYDLPQGWLCESIVAGTTCGELPFFSETERTATAQVERDCVVWLMDREGWGKLQKERPEIARELLRISLKLTSERMSSITSYILTMAG